MKANKDSNTAERIERWTAISSLALIGVTWRLWTPQELFPQVPVVSWLCRAPGWVDWVMLVSLIVGLLAMGLFFKATKAEQADESLILKASRVLVLVSLTMLILLDQHRFQPWAYMLWLATVIFATCDYAHRLKFIRYLIIGIYFYSALGKLDFEFLHTVGQQMLGAIFKWIGVSLASVAMPVRLVLVLSFPIIELLLAIGLLLPRSHRVVGICAILFHFGLILVLGPLGMNHRPGVLVWNIQIALQVYWLFVASAKATLEESDKTATLPDEKSIPQRLSFVLVCAVSIMPLFERFGYWDHWPSWALYAPHSSRVQLEISSPAIEKLPATLARVTERYNSKDAEMMAVWAAVPLDAWSLETLDTPIYPQSRFQLAVAQSVKDRVAPEFQARITILGTANRFSGKRERIELDTAEQFNVAADQFWLNTESRSR